MTGSGFRRSELTAGGGDVGCGQLDRFSATCGLEDRAHDVGDEVGLVVVHEVAGGVGDDMLGGQPRDPFALRGLPELVDLCEGERFVPPRRRGVAFPAAV